MILLVTGGRNYCEYMDDKPACVTHAERRALAAALLRIHAVRPITKLVHGAARGADKWSGLWAATMGIAVDPYAVDKAKDGPWPAAGPRRNQRMLTESKPDGFVQFPGGTGTADMTRRCLAANIPEWRPFDELDVDTGRVQRVEDERPVEKMRISCREYPP